MTQEENTLRTSTLGANSIIEKVKAFAAEKHSGQVDKGGHPYIFHALAVGGNSYWCNSISSMVVGYLHDTLEDTETTEEDLAKLGLNDYCIECIKILSKTKEDKNGSHIDRIINTPDPFIREICIRVKLSDLEDNMKVYRLKELKEKDFNRLQQYLSYYNRLKKSLFEENL